MSKFLSLFILTGAVGLCSPQNGVVAPYQTSEVHPSFVVAASGDQDKGKKDTSNVPPVELDGEVRVRAESTQPINAGDYLASRFAQSNHDWDNAGRFIRRIVQDNPNTPDDLIQRSMVLAMGNGMPDKAISIARNIIDTTPEGRNSIAEIFLIVDAVKQEDFERAQTMYNALSRNGTVDFLGPFIDAWIDAGMGKIDIKDLRDNTVQLYHSILIADYLDDHKDVEAMIDRALNVKDINLYELERIADLYGHVGLKDKAIKVYKRVLKNKPENIVLNNKIDALEAGTNEPLFEKVSSAGHGMALAFHDIATILSSEGNDESARVFGNVALYLQPGLVETLFLLADISTRHGQFDEAVELYKSIPKTDANYLDAQFEIVNIYEEVEQNDKAIDLLQDLSKSHGQPDVLIKIGDLYRHQSNFKSALKAYDKAKKSMGGTITDEFWHLHYVRGIAYEQLDQWKKAEAELIKALEFRPNHPYVLNYLGYAWADRGENLTQSRDMIQNAVSLRPNDGYITDSLGWVLYKMQQYGSAVEILERAVELLPYDATINDHLGDAYWQVGRAREARFQWRRAKNHSDDEELIETIETKLKSGLPDSDTSSLQR